MPFGGGSRDMVCACVGPGIPHAAPASCLACRALSGLHFLLGETFPVSELLQYDSGAEVGTGLRQSHSRVW